MAGEMNGPIRIVPVNTIDSAFLDRLALCVEERFLDERARRALARRHARRAQSARASNSSFRR